VRTERCVCGGTITAPSLEVAGPYIEGHNSSPEHFVWRLRQDINRERPTADVSRDLSVFFDPCVRRSRLVS
jgi:hypothetical protein